MNHSFNIDEATKYGLEEAIMIENMRFWISRNKANGDHLYDGRTWTYNSARAFSILFPYMNEKKIRRIIDSLRSQGIIITGNYNKNLYDRTLWYAFVDESMIRKEVFHNPKTGNEKPENVPPIPDINTDINTDNIYTPKNDNYDISKTKYKCRNDIVFGNDEDFEKWWLLYDKKVNRAKSRKLFERIDSKIYPLIMSHSEKYVKSCSSKEYQKNPTTYLNSHAWEDEIIIYKKIETPREKHDREVEECLGRIGYRKK